MSTHYKPVDPDLLASVFSGEGVHLGPGVVLEGLTAEQAHAKPPGLPHSIAELVAHMCHWQEWFNDCADVGFTGLAEHAGDGWPAVSPDEWDGLRARFLRSIEQAKRLAGSSGALGDPILPPGVDIAPLARESRGSGLLHGAVHSSHHLGQIITLRQLLSLWPPPGGALTW